MPDPVTNVEIEDVLSSIRRLVSDGDKARAREQAPVVADVAPAEDRSAEAGESKPDKFVLTPAFMVVDNDTTTEAAMNAREDHSAQDGERDEALGWVEEISAQPAVHEPEAAKPNDATEEDAVDAASNAADSDPMGREDVAADDVARDDDESQTDVPVLTDMIWDSVNEARKAGLAAVPPEAEIAEAADTAAVKDDSVVTTAQTPDRSKLIATIAELEAAVTNDVDDFEPDGSEVEDGMMGKTIAWPGSVARSFEDVQDAEDAAQSVRDIEAGIDDTPISFEHRNGTADAVPEDLSGAAEHTNDDYDDDFGDDYRDDDLDGLLDAGSVSLDEDALRALISEVVREELTGPLGEKITRNVRKLVRREIYRILSSKEFD